MKTDLERNLAKYFEICRFLKDHSRFPLQLAILTDRHGFELSIIDNCGRPWLLDVFDSRAEAYVMLHDMETLTK